MDKPKEFPELSRLEAVLREHLLLRAKEFAQDVEERVRKVTDPSAWEPMSQSRPAKPPMSGNGTRTRDWPHG
jgi:hypothetical protein